MSPGRGATMGVRVTWILEGGGCLNPSADYG